MNKPKRNAPCPCGSGKKYKNCCLRKKEIIKPSTREAGVRPLIGVPASPVGGETVLMCAHTGIQGHVDPTRGIGQPPRTTHLHFYWVLQRGQRPDGSIFEAQWIAICDKCEQAGVENAPLTGDYLWPDESPDAPPMIFPPQSRYS